MILIDFDRNLQTQEILRFYDFTKDLIVYDHYMMY